MRKRRKLFQDNKKFQTTRSFKYTEEVIEQEGINSNKRIVSKITVEETTKKQVISPRIMFTKNSRSPKGSDIAIKKSKDKNWVSLRTKRAQRVKMMQKRLNSTQRSISTPVNKPLFRKVSQTFSKDEETSQMIDNEFLIDQSFQDEDEFFIGTELGDEVDFFDENILNFLKRKKLKSRIDEENEKKKLLTEGRWLLNPEGIISMLINNMVILSVIYVSLFSSFKLGFVREVENPLWNPMEWVVDIVFFIDLVTTFWTPKNINNRMVYNQKDLAISYLKFWFWYDLFTLLPYSYIFFRLPALYNFIASVTFMPRIFKLFELLKLMRVLRVFKIKENVVSSTVNKLQSSDKFYFSVIPLYILVLLLAHIAACIWYYISDSDDPNSWLYRYSYRGEGLVDRYWASLYFIYTTLTTTGYGDIVPGTLNEMIATIIFMAVGVSVHSIIYTQMLEKFNQQAIRHEEYGIKKELLAELYQKGYFKKNEQIYSEMLYMIDQHTYYKLDGRSNTKGFSELNPVLKMEITMELCITRGRFDRMSFFKNTPEYFWEFFYNNMQKEIYLKDTVIYEKGQKPLKFYVVRKGSVNFVWRDLKGEIHKFVKVKSYFGEFGLFENRRTRLWTVIASQNCVVYSLPQQKFKQLFRQDNIRYSFLRKMNERLDFFYTCQRETGRAVRRLTRVKTKTIKVKRIHIENSNKLKR